MYQLAHINSTEFGYCGTSLRMSTVLIFGHRGTSLRISTALIGAILVPARAQIAVKARRQGRRRSASVFGGCAAIFRGSADIFGDSAAIFGGIDANFGGRDAIQRGSDPISTEELLGFLGAVQRQR